MKSKGNKRKKNKKKKSIAQMKQAIENISKNQKAPTPPPSYAFKSKKDYNRKDNKKAVQKGLDNG